MFSIVILTRVTSESKMPNEALHLNIICVVYTLIIITMPSPMSEAYFDNLYTRLQCKEKKEEIWLSPMTKALTLTEIS